MKTLLRTTSVISKEIPYTKINQVDASYTGRTVQRRAPLDILTLWFRWSEMPSLPIEDDCSPVLLYCITWEIETYSSQL